MSELALHLVSSIDGFIATEDGDAAPGARWDEAMQRSFVDDFTAAEGIVFGRKTYEAYYGHWSRVGRGELAAATDPERAWTQRMVAMHKYVVSNTLESPGGDTTVIGGDVPARVREVKDQQAGDLLLICGPELFAQLSAARLIDAYLLYTSPLALCRGIHLFRDVRDPIPVAPDRIVPFSSGMTLHHYRPTQH